MRRFARIHFLVDAGMRLESTLALAACLALVLLAGCRTSGNAREVAVASANPTVVVKEPADSKTATTDPKIELASFQPPPRRSVQPPVVGLTLDQAIALAVDRNPTLIAQRAAEPVAHAAWQLSTVYPFNPFVQVEVLPYVDDPAGTDRAVAHYVWLMQTLELAHQRRHREASASAAWNQVRWNIVQAELVTTAQTERLFFAALYQRELRDLAVRTAALNEELLGIVDRRFKAALATAAERTMAQVAARQSRKQAALAETSYQTAVLALQRQLNLPACEPIILVGRLEDFRWLDVPCGGCVIDNVCPDAPHEMLIASADERPDVLAAEAAVNAARANANLARANRVQNVGIGPFYERDNSGVVFGGFRTQMNLPIWDSGRPLVTQREAELRQQVTNLEQLRARAEIEAATAIQRYQRARRLCHDERGEGSQLNPQELARIKQQFEAGQADILNVFAVQTSLLQEQRTYLDLLNELAQSAADVTLTAGMPPSQIVTTGPPPHQHFEQLPAP